TMEMKNTVPEAAVAEVALTEEAATMAEVLQEVVNTVDMTEAAMIMKIMKAAEDITVIQEKMITLLRDMEIRAIMEDGAAMVEIGMKITMKVMKEEVQVKDLLHAKVESQAEIVNHFLMIK